MCVVTYFVCTSIGVGNAPGSVLNSSCLPKEYAPNLLTELCEPGTSHPPLTKDVSLSSVHHPQLRMQSSVLKARVLSSHSESPQITGLSR